MPTDKKISQDSSMSASQIRAATQKPYFPLVDPNEALSSNRNKRGNWDQIAQLKQPSTILTGTTWDGSNKSKTLTSNLSLTFSPIYQFGQLRIKQDATGGRTLSIDGNSISISTVANSVTIISYIFDEIEGKYDFLISSPVISITGTVPDITPPTIVSATAINATQIRVVFSESVIPTVGGWSFYIEETFTTDSFGSVTGSGTTWTFTIASGTMTGLQTIKLSYAPASGNTLDVAGNELASVALMDVTNNIAVDNTPPTVSSMTVEDANPNRIIVTFSEAMNQSSIPAVSSLTPNVAGSNRTVTSITFPSATVAHINFDGAAVTSGQTVLLSYTAPGTDPFEDVAGNNLANFSNQAVTNNTTGNSMQAYIDAVVAQGGSFSGAEQIALAAFKDDLTTDGIWTKIRQMGLLRNGSFASSAPNMVSPGTKDLVSTNGTVTYGGTGATGNGSTGYIDTGINLSTEFADSLITLGIYSRTNNATVAFEIGSQQATGEKQAVVSAQINGGNAVTRIDNWNVSAAGAATSNGLFMGVRHSASSLKLYKDGAEIGDNATPVSNGLPNMSAYLLAQNNDGSAATFSDREVSFWIIAEALSAGEVTTFNTRFQTLRTALGF